MEITPMFNYTKKIELCLNSYNTQMIIKNCNYRRFLYNECVRHIKSIQREFSTDRLDIPPNYLLYYIRSKYERNELNTNRPDWMEDYDYYFRGISECVVDDIMTTCKRVITDRKNGHFGDIRTINGKTSDMTFRFKNKLHRESQKNKNGLFYGNRLLIDIENPYVIGLKINNNNGYLAIELKESIIKIINDPLFDINEVREIAIKCHNDVWYLCLQCRYISQSFSKDNRDKVCGIDLGEENPVVIYNGKKIKKIPKHLQYPKNQIEKYNQKIENCQRIMDRRFNQELKDAGLPQSKRYYKILRKFHKYWERKNNILKDWHFKLTYWIVTHYKNIVVDEFHDHIVRMKSDIPSRC